MLPLEDTHDPFVCAVVQRKRFDKLKKFIPWMLPTASTLGWMLLQNVQRLQAVLAALTGFLPTQLVGFWSTAILPAWLCLLLACSVWTAFRYVRTLTNSPVEAVVRSMCLTPFLCCVHLTMTLITISIMRTVFEFSQL